METPSAAAALAMAKPPGSSPIPGKPGMPGKLPISAYIVLIVIVVVVIVSAVFLAIAATNIKKSDDYDKNSKTYPKLKNAYQLAAWGTSVGFIGAGLIVIALIVIAVAGGEFLLKSKAFIWIFAFLAVGIAIACGVLAMMSSIKLIDSGAYDPTDTHMKKGYLNDIWAALSAFIATVLVVGITIWIMGHKSKAAAVGKCGPSSPPAGPTTIIVQETE